MKAKYCQRNNIPLFAKQQRIITYLSVQIQSWCTECIHRSSLYIIPQSFSWIKQAKTETWFWLNSAICTKTPLNPVNNYKDRAIMVIAVSLGKWPKSRWIIKSTQSTSHMCDLEMWPWPWSNKHTAHLIWTNTSDILYQNHLNLTRDFEQTQNTTRIVYPPCLGTG